MYAIRSYYVIETAVPDRLVDAGDALVDHPPGAQAHVADLGVAHLSLGQADVQAGAGDQRVGRLAPEPVPHRGAGGGDGVVPALLAVSPAVQDDQYGGPGLSVALV